MNNAQEHPSAVALARAVLSDATDVFDGHLRECVECRVRAARLGRAGGIPAPGTDSLARILSADARLPEGFAAVTGASSSRSPRAGELWRAGSDEAVLVWVVRVLDGAVDAMPAVLDVDLADDATLLLTADATPLGMAVGIVTTLRSRLHPEAFLSFVAELPPAVGAQVSEVLAAYEQGREPLGAAAGTSVFEPDDQRVEYQQTLVDLLADLSPVEWASRRKAPAPELAIVDGADSAAAILALLGHDLVERHSCRVHASLDVVASLPAGALMRAVARVSFADTSVVVAVLPGWQGHHDAAVATASGRLLAQEAGASAVAVCDGPPDRLAVIVARADTREAIEPPGGRVGGPRTAREPLGLVDALAKYLDQRQPAWEAVDDGSAVAPDVAAAARTAAAASVADLAAQGRRALTPAKKQAWTGLTEATSGLIAEMVARVASGETPATAVDRLLAGGRP